MSPAGFGPGGCAYQRSAASSALLNGEISVGAGILGAATLLFKGAGKAPGGTSIGDPTVLGGLY